MRFPIGHFRWLPSRGHAWLRPAGCLFGVVVSSLTGCAAASRAVPPKAAAPTSAAATSGFVMPAGAVPWRDLPARLETSPSPPPATMPPARSAPCSAGQLSVGVDGHNGAMQSVITYYKVTNTSATVCSLGGFPKITISSSGQPDRMATLTRLIPGPFSPADLVSGASAQITVVAPTSCEPAPNGAPQASDGAVVVEIGGGGQLNLPDVKLIPACGVTASGFTFPQPPTPPSPDPRAGLRISLDAPASAGAGTSLEFAVTVTNTADTPFGFEACPNYLEALVPYAKELLQFNCPDAHPIGAGDAEVFAMRIAIPDDAPTSDATLQWKFAAPGSPAFVEVPVRVVADTNHRSHATAPSVPPCTTETGPPPCGPGATIGTAYPYALSTHCGIGTVILDGQRWVPTDPPLPASAAPYGWGDPYENGTITVLKPGVAAQFTGSTNHTVRFRGPKDGAAPAPSSACSPAAGS